MKFTQTFDNRLYTAYANFFFSPSYVKHEPFIKSYPRVSWASSKSSQHLAKFQNRTMAVQVSIEYEISFHICMRKQKWFERQKFLRDHVAFSKDMAKIYEPASKSRYWRSVEIESTDVHTSFLVTDAFNFISWNWLTYNHSYNKVSHS